MLGMEETFLLPSIPAKRIGMEVIFMRNAEKYTRQFFTVPGAKHR